MAQQGAFFKIFKPIVWAQVCAYGNWPCTKSLLNFFLDLQIKRFSGNKPHKLTQKGAFFEIFKPIIWAQLCAYGNCSCTKSLLNFFDPQLKWFSGNKLYKLTQNGQKR